MTSKPKKYRLAILISHPIHYFIDLYKELNNYPDVEVVVYFCSDFSLKFSFDETFGKAVKWYDEKILEGLPHKFLKNYSLSKVIKNFWSLINPGIIFELKKNNYDAVLIHGYVKFSDWLAFLGAKLSKTPIIMRGDAYLLNYRPVLIRIIKKIILPRLFKRISTFLGLCSTNIDYYKYYGVPQEKIFFAPYTVNNALFRIKYNELSPKKEKLRKENGLNSRLTTILYASKLVARKRPMDLLKAFEIVQDRTNNKAQLLFVDDGPEKEILEKYAADYQIRNVYFLGFKNQTELPKYYALADIFVLPSELDQWGYVINEAMNFALPVITTDMVGSSYDIVKQRENGFIYPVGDIEKLSEYLEKLIKDKILREKMGRNGLKTIDQWGYKETISGMTEALKFLKNSSVIVSQPGSHHLWRAAIGLQKAKLLKYYATGIYYKPYKFPYILINLFPKKIKDKIISQLKRREYEGLDESRVKTFGFFEWLYIINNLLIKSKNIYFWAINRRNKNFSVKVGKLATKEAKILWSGMDGSLEAFSIAKQKGVKCILDQFIGHPISLNKVLDEEGKNWPELKGLITKEKIPPEKIERLVKEIELANLIVAGSEFVKKTLIENGVSENKIAVIPYGADIKIFSPQPNKNKSGFFNLLFVGNISVRKGCHYLLEAIKQLNRQNIKLTMIGEMEDKYFLERYKNYFNWMPAVPHHQLPYYFNQADIYIYPSLFEGSSLSIYEALASGLPVIATENSGSIIRDKKDGFIIPIRDIKAVKEKILFLYNNTEGRQKMAKNARQQAKNYTWEVYHKKVIQLINNIS